MMIWMRLIFVVILFSSISTIQSLMRFKLKNQCESKMDVTLVFYDLWWGYYGRTKVDYIKTLVTNLKEACVNITLVKYVPYYDVVNVIDLSFEHWLSQDIRYHNGYLREYLQLFAEKSTTRRTLVLFSYFFGMEYTEMVYNFQMEKNVDVIIARFDTIEQFPRHLKFAVTITAAGQVTDYGVLNLKNLFDVIKNPKFDRFEFEKN